MPCVKGTFSNHSKQILLGVVFFNPNKSVITRGDRKLDVKGHVIASQALIDTGATSSCITEQLASKIDLLPDGQCEVGGVHGQQLTNTYTSSLIIPEVSFIQEGMTVIEVDLPNECPYQAILGMDILCQGTLHIDFSGGFVLCM